MHDRLLGILRGLTLAFGTTLGAPLVAGAQASSPTHMDDMRWAPTLYVLIDELEVAPNLAGRPLSLDARGWYGGAVHRLWMRAEGDGTTSLAANDGDAELQLLYGRLVHPFWDAVVGVRADRRWGGDSDGRAHLAVGLIGVAPYRFELEPTLFVSERGDLSARLEAEFPILVTQRLVAEPALELNAALQAVPRFGVRSGLNDYEFGLRFRYEVRRDFAPYIGVTSKHAVGGATTEAGSGTHIVMGLRFWR